MRWRDRFLFCAEAIYKAQTETGEIKGHYLNATAGTCEEMYKRAVYAAQISVPIIMHDYLTGGFTANTSLAMFCRDNGLLLHIHRAMHAVIDRQRNHGIHFRVLAKTLRMSGGDHLHSGTVVGKLEGEREVTLGFVDLMRDAYGSIIIILNYLIIKNYILILFTILIKIYKFLFLLNIYLIYFLF